MSTSVLENANYILRCNSSFKPGSEEVFALEADYIDTGLNNFLKQLIEMYSRIPWTMDIPVSLRYSLQKYCLDFCDLN